MFMLLFRMATARTFFFARAPRRGSLHALDRAIDSPHPTPIPMPREELVPCTGDADTSGNSVVTRCAKG